MSHVHICILTNARLGSLAASFKCGHGLTRSWNFKSRFLKTCFFFFNILSSNNHEVMSFARRKSKICSFGSVYGAVYTYVSNQAWHLMSRVIFCCRVIYRRVENVELPTCRECRITDLSRMSNHRLVENVESPTYQECREFSKNSWKLEKLKKSCMLPSWK